MPFIDKLNTPGEHALMLEGQVGALEAILTVPLNLHHSYIAFLGHPHSLQGGTMNNKVVTTLARTFKELGIPSLRFNFRGVGQSQGHYDQGIGESEDMLVLVRQWIAEQPHAKLLFAGFSFGSYVAYRTAAQLQHELLISIAPPVHHYDYKEFDQAPNPWIIVQGTADDVVPFDLVDEFARESTPVIPLIEFPDTGHFFHGNLLLLKEKLTSAIQSMVSKP
ncbi:alpha/beta hydrolase [Legionella waltersii]|uniref:Alpha/beta superfamily transporter hydrolase n=1 Tax=Legionella waltersii TaxID=66969 RepID=A0A0W1AD52_9GAMM|nr:alpha/beta family hydrolase [Legionella waltersii]KTD79261.1 alpha/beta superfamily transporter hydrolase [Legionella waltersii]SNV12765.1 transmembrane protein [Legionella waltersii]